ncbi:D-tyrosyl-tRNA deacylase [Gonapodya prolifera JEL478]|uniref:D-aminoacyl-tRNA deacylase n=1 Tax=Gonapodya prolifera (strain JEL478) TaxID=1344416 RepID=A0A139ATL4_GONPJ|nr:D-tyrosyl-tRNA deacylase [Gonapodya prolifera JEL478]|eukprot:KXS20034.1 D-tyrosyl-tRNA deacylase [Gonapodya prolifera JEL478]
MRLVLQRVSRASVTVDGETVSSIGRGICVLVGIAQDDQEKADADVLAKKLLDIRMWPDGEKAWAKGVRDIGGEVLCVSQFTLHARLNKGTKPDFSRAMKTAQAREFYETFLAKLRSLYDPEKIKDGVFGAMMSVEIVNDGPVTLVIDSRKEGEQDRKPVGEGSAERSG